ncbi:MAG: class I SAM-dependent methyltransferase [Candidatus Magasanikbacteria bacterium CG10_big_fil_rev_8_21_14_0_10_43_9]|nr:MAG: class I SAM-dependent methyltransferase [Candidatus Magasanikbacteria bacterium CG10_big_fil_rev_8_21_14_0_10_43_9]PIY92441.1 MAG: class I SAM-dependent methyltransferase [Candidatus Magasanikbacteria bacterium CG_4_10_14_0_8_um_filter_42_12]
MRDYQKETIETYNKQAVAFQKTRAGFFQKDKVEKFLSLLRGKRILDIGCGPGRDCAVFAEKGFSVTGVDVVPTFIDMAREQVPNATFELMDVLNLTFDEHTFDGVWASAVLLHLKREDIPQALRQIYRVLTAGGVCRFSVKKGTTEGMEADVRLGNAKRFFTYFEENEIKLFVLEAGFIIEEIKTEADGMGRNIEWIDAFVKKSL